MAQAAAALRAVALILGASLAHAGTQPGPSGDSLRIEQWGETDSALRPFTIVIGPPEATTRDIVYVDTATFSALQASARDGSLPYGPFRITVQTSGAGPQRYFLRGERLAALMRPVCAMFQSMGLRAPGFLLALAGPTDR